MSTACKKHPWWDSENEKQGLLETWMPKHLSVSLLLLNTLLLTRWQCHNHQNQNEYGSTFLGHIQYGQEKWSQARWTCTFQAWVVQAANVCSPWAVRGVQPKGSWRLQASAWSKLGGYRHLVSSCCAHWQAQGVIGLGWLGSKWPRTSHGKPSNTSHVHLLLRLLFLHETILVTMSCHVCHSFLPFHDTPKLNMSSVKTTLSAVAGMFKTKRNGRNGRKATICVPRFQWTQDSSGFVCLAKLGNKSRTNPPKKHVFLNFNGDIMVILWGVWN